MPNPSDTLHIVVEYFDGTEPDDVGYPYYVASCDQIGAVTDGQTLDALFANIREVVALALEDEDTVATYNVVPDPKINITLTFADYARIT